MGVDDIYTRTLLHFDGADSSTTITDEARNVVWAASGNAQLKTAQAKFGATSLYLDGTGDYIRTYNGIMLPGALEFTIDFWMYPNSLGTNVIFDNRAPGGGGANAILIYITGNKLIYWTDGSNRITSVSNVQTGQWTHVALVGNGSDVKLYMGGSQEGSTYTAAYNHSGNINVVIGAAYDGSAAYYDGYLDEFRASVGIQRWTANFTPPVQAYRPAPKYLTSRRNRFGVNGVSLGQYVSNI